MEFLKRISLKNVLKTIIVMVVVYNMVVVPFSPIGGIRFPPLLIDEATKTVLFLTTLG